jgi:hypothetical protein
MATTTTNAPAMPGAWKVNLPEDLLAALAAFGLFFPILCLPWPRPPPRSSENFSESKSRHDIPVSHVKSQVSSPQYVCEGCGM